MSPVLSRTYTDFSTKRIVYEKVVERRVGFEKEVLPAGWKWDCRHLVGDKIAETLPFPGIKTSHLLGIPRDYWQNGSISGSSGDSLEVQEVVEVFANGRERWVPKIHRGGFIIWRQPSYLFSDDSVIETLDPLSLDSDGRSTHTLARELRPNSPIAVTIFQRDSLGEISPWRTHLRRERFSGLRDVDDNELTTRSGDTLYWANVDTTKNEFLSIVRDDSIFLQFNKSVVESISRQFIPADILDFNEMEYLGTSNGSDDQQFTTKYFPIGNSSNLYCYVVNNATSTWTAYSVVTSFTAANQVIIDYDLGVLTFGTSASGPTPALPPNRAVYLAYQAVPRIEYEEYGYSDVFTAKEADVNPVAQSLNKGFVVVGRGELDISSIILSTTKSSYRADADTFGPVYVGADYASLLAHVYSSAGSLVPNAEVTFWITTAPAVGGVGGSGSSAQRRTGYDGIARCAYTPPTSVDSMGFFVTSVGVGNTVTLPSGAAFEDTADVYTYHVLKDDPWKGKVGADTSIGEIPWSASPPNGRKVIFYKWDAAAVNPVTGKLGAYAPVRPSSISGGNVLTYADTLAPPDPTPSNVNLGAYWIVSDRYVSIQASVYSPRLNRTILSNTIKIRVEIPLYMRGEYIKNNLNAIPFGWRIKDTTYEVASAFGGATYISINPFAGPYPIVDVIAGETWDPYCGFDPYSFWPYDFSVTGPYPYVYEYHVPPTPPFVERGFANLGFSFTIV